VHTVWNNSKRRLVTVMSDSDRYSGSRKSAAMSVKNSVRWCLADYYDAAKRRVVSTQNEPDGSYEGEGDYCATDMMDYAGVDWLVDEKPAIIPVAERIRPNKPNRRDFSIRLENGGIHACESSTIPSGLMRGLAPEAYLFGWRSGRSLDRAWLLNCRKLFQKLVSNAIDVERRPSGDGTVAGYISVASLAASDIVLESWDDPAGGSQ